MEIFYALGIWCIQFLQERASCLEFFMNIMNRVFNPHLAMEYGFPIVCSFDSVFGAQLLLSLAFGSWANTMLKLILVEDRPFWWVRETSYYADAARPELRQGAHTCETSPGSPSGHVATAATLFMLAHMWICHYLNDTRATRLRQWYEGLPIKAGYFFLVFSASIARMYAGAHFPHQCLLGGLIGSFLTPSVCLFVTDPYLFASGWERQAVRTRMMRHLKCALLAGGVAALLALVYSMMRVDMHWATRLAFRWCETPEQINVKSTPVFSFVQSVGSLIGFAIAVSPEITKYRHNTEERNYFVSFVGTIVFVCFFRQLQDMIPTRRLAYYGSHFALSVVKPVIYLRVLPHFALDADYRAAPYTLDSPRRTPRAPPPPATSAVAYYGCHFALSVVKPVIYLRVLPHFALDADYRAAPYTLDSPRRTPRAPPPPATGAGGDKQD